MTWRTKNLLHGPWRIGRNWTRSWLVLNSNVAVTNGGDKLGLIVPSLTVPFFSTRRILLFPFGNSNAPPNDTVSVYLDYAEPKKAPEGWHACAQFALVISNVHDPTIFTVSRTYRIWSAFTKINCLYEDAHHRFIAEECDWGFTRFSELRKLFNPHENQPRPTIEDEAADITVFVRVLEDPTGVLWHNFVKWAHTQDTLSLPNLVPHAAMIQRKKQVALVWRIKVLHATWTHFSNRSIVHAISAGYEVPI